MDNYLEKTGEFFNFIFLRVSQWFSDTWIFLSENLDFAEVYTFIARWGFPILAVMILFRCVAPLLRQEEYDKVWGFLGTENGYRIPIKHWENSIGRSKLSDIQISLPFISRSHAVLTYGLESWQVSDLGSKGGVCINGERIDKNGIAEDGDILSFSGAEFQIIPVDDEYNGIPSQSRFLWLNSLSDKINSSKTFVFILLFQILGAFQVFLSMGENPNLKIPFAFLIYIMVESLYFVFINKISEKYSELELLVFFLCGLNLLVVASATPEMMYKQLAAIILGIAAYFTIQIIIKDYERARKFKYVLAVSALALIMINLVMGETRYGAKNWINLGFTTFQPMEFVKVSFVLAGTATLDKLLTTRNLTAFIGFSGVCLGALVIMRDLGTAVIFFGAFLVISFMRSGDLRTIALISSGAALGAFAVVSFLPYIAARFQAWGHVWEYSDTMGFQQTRTMIATASGGMLGVGGGNGYLVDVPASDTDLVFGILCEEWGLIVGLCAIFIIVFIAIYSVIIMKRCKSSLYAISASGAATIFLIQTALNVFGSIDFLPLTGVTLPFVSNGGSSMLVCWSLLAFIKSADERSREKISEEGWQN